MENKTGLADGYIHGFTKEEQDRLFEQSRIHEPIIFSHIDFKNCESIIEVGSGVGAQTKILLERFPQLKIQCIDASTEQIQRARIALSEPLQSGQIKIDQADALHLPFKDNTYDGAFLCWLLEHVQEPVEILREVGRVLKPGGILYCNEVFNSTFYVHPYAPATLKYWIEFNDYQRSLKGDPFVGGKLANYFMAAGYQYVSTQVLTHQYDNRTPKKRAVFIDYWTQLLLSGAPGMIQAGRVTKELVDEMTQEFKTLKSANDSVIFYSWILARGETY